MRNGGLGKQPHLQRSDRGRSPFLQALESEGTAPALTVPLEPGESLAVGICASH